jgi:hypothetical protein
MPIVSSASRSPNEQRCTTSTDANGVKDFDVYMFYAAHPTGTFPYRWRTEADFGSSRFGRYPGDPESFRGLRVDLIGRSLDVFPDADPVEAVERYLTAGRTKRLGSWR